VRAPLAGIDERQPAWVPPTYSADPDLRSQALNALIAASCDADEAQHRQSELARIRAEIMDVARDLATLRQRKPANSANIVPSNPVRIASRHHAPVREPKSNSRQAPVVAAPAREQWPLLAIGDDVMQPGPVKAKTAARPKAPVQSRIAVKATAKAKDAVKPAKRRGVSLAAKAALFAGLMLAGTAAIAVTLQGKLPLLAYEPLKASRLFADSASPATESTAVKPGQPQLASLGDQTSALYPFDMPDTYGVYAVGDGGQLTALEPLPIRVLDARVPVSNPITKPAPAPATSGTPLFVVYHRELATNVPENATVRVVAKVMQASIIVGGKPKPIPVQDSWAVRGGAIDLRIAPIAANKEMILIRPADPNFTLSPGRYVLMFKNQAYDFTVAGEVTDLAQCLERSDLEDKSVYSECRELPASAAKS
jgi:hypothetical protein